MPQTLLLSINRIAISLFYILLVDIVLLDSYLRQVLPSSVTDIVWYSFIFGLPHIIASYASYCSKEYFLFYKQDLYKGILYTSLLVGVISLLSPSLLFYFFIIYTVLHVAGQQLGLCIRYARSIKLFKIWKLLGTGAMMAFVLSVGGELQMNVPAQIIEPLWAFGSTCVILFLLIGLYLFRGEGYGFTVTLIIFFGACAIMLGYPIIGILMIRFTHDASAFSIYIKHDMAYKRTSNTNLLYAFFTNPLHIVWFLPIVSLVVAFFLQVFKSPFTIIIIIILSLTHYYMEGKVWRKGYLHGKTIAQS